MTPTVLFGREQERASLHDLVARLTAGHGGAALVEGEPGIGKTALLAAASAEAARRGCQVFTAAADELGSRFPLQVLLDCLDTATRSAMTGSANGGWALSGDPVTATIERFLAFVDRACAVSPVLLVADDLQWADDATFQAWSRLAHSTEQLPLLLVGAHRPVPRRPELVHLRRGLRDRGAALLQVGALPAESVVALAGELAGAPVGPRIRDLTTRAGGNPLYIRELFDALRRDNKLAVRDGIAEFTSDAAEPAVPTSLVAAIGERLDFLSEPTVEALRMAVLLGTEFSVVDLATTLGRPPTDLVGIIDEAAAAGVLVASGEQLAFRHPLLRQVLYEGMPAGLRTALHGQAAQSLTRAGAPVDRVAEQWLAAPEIVDTEMLDWLRASAPALIQRAPRIATDLLERTLSAIPADSSHRDQLEAYLASVSFLLAHNEPAEKLARGILARTSDPELIGQMTWTLVYSLLRTNQHEQALDLASKAVVDPRLDPVWRARLGAERALLLVVNERPDEAVVAAEAVLADPDQAGDRAAAGYAHHTLSLVHMIRHDTEGAARLAGAALDTIGDDPDTADLRQVVLTHQINMLRQLDRRAEADACVHEVTLLAERTGTARQFMVSSMCAECLVETGRWDDALTTLESFSDHMPSEDEWPVLNWIVHGMYALIAGHRDDRTATAEHLHVDRADGPRAFGDEKRYLLKAHALVAERAGEPEEAMALLAAELGSGQATHEIARHAWLPQLTRLAVSCDDQQVVDAAITACTAEAELAPTRRRAAAASWCTGLGSADPAPILVAAEYYREVKLPLDCGQAHEDAAILLAERGDVSAARRSFSQAVEVYLQLGAAWDLMRAESRIRPHGIRRGQRGQRRRPTVGWDALTPTEVKVARLVADGGSNPDIAAQLFLSRRTVQTHVSHILGKLGVQSRWEIARLAVPRTPDPRLRGDGTA